jgi:hypothetical protein
VLYVNLEKHVRSEVDTDTSWGDKVYKEFRIGVVDFNREPYRMDIGRASRKLEAIRAVSPRYMYLVKDSHGEPVLFKEEKTQSELGVLENETAFFDEDQDSYPLMVLPGWYSKVGIVNDETTCFVSELNDTYEYEILYSVNIRDELIEYPYEKECLVTDVPIGLRFKPVQNPGDGLEYLIFDEVLGRIIANDGSENFFVLDLNNKSFHRLFVSQGEAMQWRQALGVVIWLKNDGEEVEEKPSEVVNNVISFE